MGIEHFAVTASNPRPSTHLDITGALDVDVTVVVGAQTIQGEVTLAPAQYDGRLAAYGAQPDYWVSGGLLAALRGMTDTEYRTALTAIEAAAIEAVTSEEETEIEE